MVSQIDLKWPLGSQYFSSSGMVVVVVYSEWFYSCT